ncbi:MAG: hypothetical protein BWY82_02953 [Verrucomicrobia bacterium ADurb.Bin474]|nr:MAG: hypothetical protein BWY82_02953 [Verrucomicrobia bacterium ADurb.Bin474]
MHVIEEARDGGIGTVLPLQVRLHFMTELDIRFDAPADMFHERHHLIQGLLDFRFGLFLPSLGIDGIEFVPEGAGGDAFHGLLLAFQIQDILTGAHSQRGAHHVNNCEAIQRRGWNPVDGVDQRRALEHDDVISQGLQLSAPLDVDPARIGKPAQNRCPPFPLVLAQPVFRSGRFGVAQPAVLHKITFRLFG